MNTKQEGCLAVVVWALAVAGNAYAAGFSLYEASAKTYALGGAVIGKAVDASANFHNPATLTDLTNITVTAGFMTEHPRARMKVDGGGSTPMDPGAFFLPSFQLAVPLPWDFSFGLGAMPEYGLGTAYDNNWALNNNSLDTTVLSYTINPNLAYKITDRWSVAAGLRFLYFDFDQHSMPSVRNAAGYRLNNHLYGHNAMKDLGWQAGTKYDLFDNFSLGLVYKSRTVTTVEGYTENTAGTPGLENIAAATSGEATTDLELPQSITGGFNWDITRTVHLGGMLSWSQWSNLDTLYFNMPNGTGGRYDKQIHLNWNDTWRTGLGASWDFIKDWSVLGSYVFENDCSKDQDSTMLPASNRHMLSCGLAWNCWGGLEIALTYGMILMDGLGTHATAADGHLAYYEAYRGLSHAAGLSLTYRF